tara:strand:+ start:412 stop:780 length:369 start_codon:yes stop_codon:yes gene_type:complete
MSHSYVTSSKIPSQRQLRVAEAVRGILSQLLLQTDFYDSPLAGLSITVSEVRISPDLKNASVFVLPLGGEVPEGFVDALAQIAPSLRHEVGIRAKLRYTPMLTFKLDESFANAARVESLLNS